MNDQDLDAQGQAWVEIQALCCSLSISRSALGRLRRRELLRYWHHWVKKSPTATPYGSSCSSPVELSRRNVRYTVLVPMCRPRSRKPPSCSSQKVSTTRFTGS